jgi:hypothetical protein
MAVDFIISIKDYTHEQIQKFVVKDEDEPYNDFIKSEKIKHL